MGWADALIQQGYVPSGATPKSVITPGGEAGYYQTDPLSNLSRAMEQYQVDQQKEQDRKIKTMEKKLDMYKTLRNSGYDTERAFSATRKIEMPDEAPGQTFEEKKADLENQKTTAEIAKINAEAENAPYNKGRLQARIIDKVASGSELTAGEQKIYDETIKKKGNDLETLLADQPTHQKLRDQILAKVADGTPLSAGEQKVYDETIRKYGNKSDPLTAALSEKSPAAKTGLRVKMFDPQGNPKLVHPDDVSKAIAAGWRKR